MGFVACSMNFWIVYELEKWKQGFADRTCDRQDRPWGETVGARRQWGDRSARLQTIAFAHLPLPDPCSVWPESWGLWYHWTLRTVVITSKAHRPLRNSLDLKNREKPESWSTCSRAHSLVWEFMQEYSLLNQEYTLKARDCLLSLVAACILCWLFPMWLAIRDSRDTPGDDKHTKSWLTIGWLRTLGF